MAARQPAQTQVPRYALLLLALISILCFAVAIGIYDHNGAKYEDYMYDWGDGLAVASVSLQPPSDSAKWPLTNGHPRYCRLCSGPYQSSSTTNMEFSFVPVGTSASNS